MPILYDSNGTEIGRVYVHGTIGGTGADIATKMSNPESYVFQFEGDGARVKEGDYRVDFDDGKTVQLCLSRVSRAEGVWLLTCDVKKSGSEA